MSKLKSCPGEEAFLDDRDLSDSAFNRVVARRARKFGMELDGEIRNREERLGAESFLEKVHLKRDFLPASFLADGGERAKAICRIRVRNANFSGFGTGFLVAPNVIMTNNHVLEDGATATTSVAEFDFDDEDATVRTITLRPDDLFITNEELDFTLVACEPVEGVPFIPLLSNPAVVTRHERVNVIQHPAGRPKEVALHDNHVERLMTHVIRYRTDTEPGSSGSPVFNNNWELVALHHAGFNQPGGQALNEGIRISAIVAHLLGRRHNELQGNQLLASLLDASAGTNPHLGFFDLVGIHDDNSEVVVDSFVGSREFCDVGFWNIEHFNRNVSDRRVNAVADVVNTMSLDVLGLTEVQKEAMDRLIVSLNRQGMSADYELLDVAGGQDIAVLFDASTTKVKVRGDIATRHSRRLSKQTPSGRSAFPRKPFFVECTVQDDTGRSAKFLMIVVHLKAFGDATSRSRRRLAAQMLAEIIDDIREQEGIQIVLGGDFNEKLDNDVLGAITGSPDLFSLTLDDATSGDRAAISFVGDRHRSLIDHIVVSRDVQMGDVSGDDAAIVRLDRNMPDFADDVSDHVPVAFRMVFRNAPIAVDPDEQNTGRRLEIPAGSDSVRLIFEDNDELRPNGNGSKPKKSKKRQKV